MHSGLGGGVRVPGEKRSEGSIPVLDDDRVGSRVASAEGGVQDERGVVQGEVIDRVLADHAIDHEQDLMEVSRERGGEVGLRVGLSGAFDKRFCGCAS